MRVLPALLFAALGAGIAVGQAPVPVDLVETERLRLLILDTVVVDSKDRTVPGLTKDDFDVILDSEPTTIDTLDVDCDVALDEPREADLDNVQARALPHATPGGKIVLAFDYLHLSQEQRVEVFDYALELAANTGPEAEEVLIAAFDGSLRVEQPFTTNRAQVHDALQRMRQDITLWEPSFEHLTEFGWIDGITTLLDALGTFPGPKKIVLFSAMEDVPLDIEFQEIAALAAATRCAIYPVDIRGLTAIGTPTTGRARPG